MGRARGGFRTVFIPVLCTCFLADILAPLVYSSAATRESRLADGFLPEEDPGGKNDSRLLSLPSKAGGSVSLDPSTDDSPISGLSGALARTAAIGSVQTANAGAIIPNSDAGPSAASGGRSFRRKQAKERIRQILTQTCAHSTEARPETSGQGGDAGSRALESEGSGRRKQAKCFISKRASAAFSDSGDEVPWQSLRGTIYEVQKVLARLFGGGRRRLRKQRTRLLARRRPARTPPGGVLRKSTRLASAAAQAKSSTNPLKPADSEFAALAAQTETPSPAPAPGSSGSNGLGSGHPADRETRHFAPGDGGFSEDNGGAEVLSSAGPSSSGRRGTRSRQKGGRQSAERSATPLGDEGEKSSPASTRGTPSTGGPGGCPRVPKRHPAQRRAASSSDDEDKEGGTTPARDSSSGPRQGGRGGGAGAPACKRRPARASVRGLNLQGVPKDVVKEGSYGRHANPEVLAALALMLLRASGAIITPVETTSADLGRMARDHRGSASTASSPDATSPSEAESGRRGSSSSHLEKSS